MTVKLARERVSRRNLVGRAATASAAAGLAVGAVGAGIATAAPIGRQRTQPAQHLASVVATVVRSHHSATVPGAMSVGVRASVFGPGLSGRGLVLVIEPIEFGTTEQVNQAIADGLRLRVTDMLAQRGQEVAPEEIAVQLFGGSL